MRKSDRGGPGSLAREEPVVYKSESARSWVLSTYKRSKRYAFFFSSRRRHTRLQGDWSSDVCSSDLGEHGGARPPLAAGRRAYRLVRAFPLAGGRRRNGIGSRSVRPPAPSIARTAAAENAWARTGGGFVSWPRPGTLTHPRLAAGPPDPHRPASTPPPAPDPSGT